ncbi:MAG: 3-hydroxyacyl-CoA dehydrogenase NAD-binding domain-containing protein [Oligoflexales bacterium]
MAVAGFGRIAVVGAGQMGRGIAQVCACQGIEVSLMDLNENVLEIAKTSIFKSVTKLQSKGIISESEMKATESIVYVNRFEELAAPDLVIEAIVENESIKKEVFLKLDNLLPSKTIFASNTSSLPITRLASATKRPEMFVGMHFMNPVPLMKLVEVIPGLATKEDIIQRISHLATGLGKEVSMSKDYPGFVVNRILMPMINEAFTALMEGVATADDIDKGMKLGTNQPMGPLTLADFIGLDTCLAIMEVLYKGFGDSRYRPSALLKQYVDAGWLGRKTGRGVYQY